MADLAVNSTEGGLLRAVRDDPGADLPRLVYADYLEATAGTAACQWCYGWGRLLHGAACPTCSRSGRVSDGRAERAEFIRVQCELERVPPCVHERFADHIATVTGVGTDLTKMRQRGGGSVDTCGRCQLKKREQELMRTDVPHPNGGLRSRWESWLPTDWLLHSGPPEFRRGFVEAVTCPASAWEALGDELLLREPVRRVGLTNRPGVEVCDFPAERVRVCRLPGLVGREVVLRVTERELMADPGRDRLYDLLELAWPGVRFSVPTPAADWAAGNDPLGDWRRLLARAHGEVYHGGATALL